MCSVAWHDVATWICAHPEPSLPKERPTPPLCLRPIAADEMQGRGALLLLLLAPGLASSQAYYIYVYIYIYTYTYIYIYIYILCIYIYIYVYRATRPAPDGSLREPFGTNDPPLFDAKRQDRRQGKGRRVGDEGFQQAPGASTLQVETS